jgi:transposase
MRALLQRLFSEWLQLDRQIDDLTRELVAFAAEDPACHRLLGVPGIGPIVATAIVAAIGTGGAFTKGRDFAAARSRSTAAFHGWQAAPARSAAGQPPSPLPLHLGHSPSGSPRRDRHPFSEWLGRLEARVHRNVAVVALANKIARITWAVLAHGDTYLPQAKAA